MNGSDLAKNPSLLDKFVAAKVTQSKSRESDFASGRILTVPSLLKNR
jgi:hypothetical protein